MRRIPTTIGFNLALFTLICGTAELASAERPNMIVVLIDDLRWDELSCTGHPFVRTPSIDRIAREGARFRNAFATTPLCSPSRACFLTGQCTHRHGILDNTDRSVQSHQLETFPRALRQAGYETAFIGKWHMGNDPTARPGFDHWIALHGQGSSRDPQLNENGKSTRASGYTTDVLNARAVEFLQRTHDRPFLLYLSHKALHPELVQYDDGSISDPSAAKFIAAERHESLYQHAPIPRRLNCLDDLTGKPALQRTIDDLPPLGPTTGTSDDTIRDRLRMLAAVDEGVGQLFDALERSRQLKNTVFVVASDHGYFYGEHGLSVERRLAYEEAIRIPLLIRYPKMIAAGRLVDAIALSVDVAPTLLQLAGVQHQGQMDGRSLMPLLSNAPPDDWRKAFLIEYNTDTVFPRVRNMGYRAVRTERYKYIHYLELEGMDELYDLATDPYEMRNLIDDAQAQDVAERLREALRPGR